MEKIFFCLLAATTFYACAQDEHKNNAEIDEDSDLGRVLWDQRFAYDPLSPLIQEEIRQTAATYHCSLEQMDYQKILLISTAQRETGAMINWDNLFDPMENSPAEFYRKNLIRLGQAARYTIETARRQEQLAAQDASAEEIMRALPPHRDEEEEN
jgi:hypothetical protein